MADTTTLTSQSPREAVADALHRCILGVDSNDHAFFESSFLTDETMTVVAGSIILNGWTEVSNFFQRVFQVTTTHFTSNIRVDLKSGADTASMTAHAIAYHIRPEDAFKPDDTSYTAGNLYNIDLVKDAKDSLWKIKKWSIMTLWTTGDIATLHG